MTKATEIRSASEVGHWDLECDVLVVGLGCAGASAAIEAADRGAEVVVLERAGGGGGTSANSGGLIYLGGGTPVQQVAGFEDSVEALERFLVAASGPGADEAKIHLFAEHSVDHFHWLEGLGVPFKRSFYEEPSMESPTDDCLVYSGGEDCAPFADTIPPAPRGHKPQTEGKAGPFFMQCMLAAVEARPIRVEANWKVEALVQDAEGRIVGACGKRAGEAVAARARGGLVLAAGGFAVNREMVARHVPQLAPVMMKNATDGDDGTGIRLGEAAGGTLVRMDQAEVALPATIPVRMGRGLYLNRAGQRFINEDTYYGHIGIEALFGQDGRVFLLLDDATFERNMVGMQPTVVGETIAEVAAEAGFPPGALEATVALYNQHAEKGEDPVFGKRREMLVPLTNPPYALLDCSVTETIYAGMTLGGLATGRDGEVLRPDGGRVDGLYAVGRTSALFCGRGYAGSGISLTDGTFFGRRAGRAAAGAR